MAKNYVQDGKTIPLINSGTTDILSGEPVVVGSLITVAITDIAAGQTGDGLAEGVFMLPKLPADDIPAGTAIFIKDGKVQLAEEDAVAAGIAWEEAGTGVTVVDVKING